MHISEILNVKGHTVLSTTPEASIAEVIAKLVENRCGSLVVCRENELVGVISERDILITLAEVDKPLTEITVEERMTKDVVTGTPDDDVNEVLGIMTTKRIRHLPIIEKGGLTGVISIGDIVKAQHDQLALENHYLMNYIQS